MTLRDKHIGASFMDTSMSSCSHRSGVGQYTGDVGRPRVPHGRGPVVP